jgi:hypothetical protein
LPLSLSPFFNQTVSASKGVEALKTARHSRVLDNISNRAQVCEKSALSAGIRPWQGLTGRFPLSSFLMDDQGFTYRRYCEFSGTPDDEPTNGTESAAQIDARRFT